MGISSYGARTLRASIFPIVLSRLLRAIMISKTWCGLSSIRPVNSSKSVIPSENMSERTVTSLALRPALVTCISVCQALAVS